MGTITTYEIAKHAAAAYDQLVKESIITDDRIIKRMIKNMRNAGMVISERSAADGVACAKSRLWIYKYTMQLREKLCKR